MTEISDWRSRSTGYPGTKAAGVRVLPFTREELADFEALIFAANDADQQVRLKAREELAAFIAHHSKIKCDLMCNALARLHGNNDTKGSGA